MIGRRHEKQHRGIEVGNWRPLGWSWWSEGETKQATPQASWSPTKAAQ